MAPELRRCCWYCIGAFLPIVAFAGWLAANSGNPSASVVPFFVLFGIPVVAAAYFLTWRLELTENGVIRRTAIDTIEWPWTAFKEGLVEKRGSALYCPQYGLMQRRIELGLLSRDCARVAYELINEHYRLPDFR